MRRFVFFFILIIFAVLTPAWSEVLRNTNIDYVLDLYKKVESFGFYKNLERTELIGTGTFNGSPVSGNEGVNETNAFKINPEKQYGTPQYYFIIRSNHPEHSYDFKLTVSAFNHHNGNSIGYSLLIRDMDNKTNIFTVASADIKSETISEVELNDGYVDVTSDTKPDEWVWGFYYYFDSDELAQAAEGEYISTVKMEVTVQ